MNDKHHHHSDQDLNAQVLLREVRWLKARVSRLWGRAVTKRDLLATERRLSKQIADIFRPRVRFDWVVGPVQLKAQPTEKRTMEIKITNEQKIKVTLNPNTGPEGGGRPARLDGKPSWEVVLGDSTVEVAEDGMSATLISSDLPGETDIMVKADADLGEGVEEISEIIHLGVSGATAKNLGLVIGTPEPKEVTPPTPETARRLR